ncbi:drug resistance transporter, EmrB/QacA protein [Arthrobacter sp. Hiyo8]|nr:drug resistance transporter, EmrB/QacA protein [Arthrobacter sp. Hiyo8]
MFTPSTTQHPRTSSIQSAPWRDWAALALLMFPVLLVAVDNTALTFALPEIARSLEVGACSCCGSWMPIRWCSQRFWCPWETWETGSAAAACC